MNHKLWKTALGLLKKNKIIVLAGSLIASACFSSELPIPRVNAVDKFGVNMASGQISHTVETLSIGGTMGLSHSISGFTNSFSFIGYRGYHDKYLAKGRYGQIATGDSLSGGGINQLYAYTVSDLSESAAFLYYVNGVLAPQGSDSPSAVYVALADSRHTLVVDPSNAIYLKWTKPDGTIIKFRRTSGTGSSTPATSWSLKSESFLEEVIYPNGFTISVFDTLPSSVRTNTGFQLKYNYDGHSAVMDKPDVFIDGLSYTTTDWGRNPTSIKGINAAVEYCADTNSCGFSKTWPTATFTWPGGMPRTLFINYPINANHPTLESGVFKLVDAKGGVTEYHFQAQDLTKDCSGFIFADQTPKPAVNPRLVGIKTADSKVVNFTYNYCNVLRSLTGQGSSPFLPPQYINDSELGIIRSATKNGEASNYTLGQRLGNNDLYNNGGGNVTGATTRGLFGGNLSYVDTREGRYIYEVNGGPHGWRNFIEKFRPYAGIETLYGYDARGNLISVCKNSQCSTAGYSASCPNPKTCNKPLWTKDARLNQTDYTYHQASGQVEMVTSPANKNGVRAQTRYEYAQHYARYYGPNGTWITGSPIWLKTAERSCTNSSYAGVGDGASHFIGSCGAGDQEVVTRYEYNSNNLYLTGMTVTADNKTLRTCFQYDIYGNQIGKTQPNAGLNSCPQL